jgi:16S rRNA pseudouridine516 synthase
MFGRFRNPVLALHRVSIGEVKLDDDLAPGEYRALRKNEVNLK